MRCPFDSEEAQEINIKIFETIYYAALTASCELAQQDGPYSSYEGSPVSKGVSKHVCVCVWRHIGVCIHACGFADLMTVSFSHGFKYFKTAINNTTQAHFMIFTNE